MMRFQSEPVNVTLLSVSGPRQPGNRALAVAHPYDACARSHAEATWVTALRRCVQLLGEHVPIKAS